MYRPSFFAIRAWFPRMLTWRRYAGVLALTLAAWAVCDMFAKIGDAYVFYLPFLAAIAVAASWGGRLPAALTLAAGLILTWAACLSAPHPVSLPLEVLRSLLYVIVGVTIIACVDRSRRAPQETLDAAKLAPAREAGAQAGVRTQRNSAAPLRDDRNASLRLAGHLADDIAVSESDERISRLLRDRKIASRTDAGHARDLRAPPEDLEALLNLIPVPIYLAHDPECRQMTTNRAAVDLLEPPPQKPADPEEEPHPYAHRVFHLGRELGPHEMPIQRAAAEGIETRGEEYEIVFEDYSVKHIFGYASPLYAADGSIRGSLATFIDITRRKRAENALRESEERFRLLADSAPVMIWVADNDGRHTYFNRTWLEFTGRSLAQEIETEPMSAVHVDDQAQVRAHYRSHFERREKFSMEYRMRRHDGVHRWVLNVGSPRHDANGEFVGYIGTCTDISNNKLYEQRLEQADRQKDEFIATLAHELRNPLAPIRNALHILGSDAVDAAGAQWAREVMERQVKQLVRLVDDLLDVARITRGHIELRRELTTVDSIINDAVEASRPLMEEGKHWLDVSIPGTPVSVNADHTRATEIIINLLNNAAKYTPRGGHIWIDCEVRTDEVAISVSDNGIGIEAKSLPRIFQMFTQLDHSLERAQGGLGVGLALARKLAELHGGRLEAASAGRGCGSRFTLSLPTAIDAKAAAPLSPQGASDDVSPRRILVVDDNVDAAESLVRLLELMGHQVHTAHDGVSALKMLDAVQPDIVFLDIGLPGMNGYDLPQRVRQLPTSGHITLIALTGRGEEQERAHAFAAGFDDHLTKPVALETLRETLKRRAAAA
ncbi:MAG TPA: PAS domain S-box protein [Burkholderiales bacterium]|nr:PAS domain S-box protein [Burkholderiales bacterium]